MRKMVIATTLCSGTAIVAVLALALSWVKLDSIVRDELVRNEFVHAEVWRPDQTAADIAARRLPAILHGSPAAHWPAAQLWVNMSYLAAASPPMRSVWESAQVLAVPPNPTPSHPIPPHHISPNPIRSHPDPSHPIGSHPIVFYLHTPLQPHPSPAQPVFVYTSEHGELGGRTAMRAPLVSHAEVGS